DRGGNCVLGFRVAGRDWRHVRSFTHRSARSSAVVTVFDSLFKSVLPDSGRTADCYAPHAGEAQPGERVGAEPVAQPVALRRSSSRVSMPPISTRVLQSSSELKPAIVNPGEGPAPNTGSGSAPAPASSNPTPVPRRGLLPDDDTGDAVSDREFLAGGRFGLPQYRTFRDNISNL